MSLKERIKNAAYELGADLVGIGDIDRCRHAPPMMSPQGIFPSAKSVIVMAVRHPDACVELGGEEHPQKMGPYSVQGLMNSRLDEMAYRLATVIEREGYRAIPIASSNIWRYNSYKELSAVFAPDVSHIYMAVVAGLAEIGISGLALTPEFGARNRFITVIADVELEPDPLIPPGTVCDNCGLCRKHCPAQALTKEIDGEKVLKIGPYEYRFPNKNLWRCAWGEHFDLDLDLRIPEKVTEQVILDAISEHGLRGGEMGQCLKFCVPKAHRQFDRAYSSSPVRKAWTTTDPAAMPRGVVDRLLSRAVTGGADTLIVIGADSLRLRGIDIGEVLPGATSAVTLAATAPEGARNAELHQGASYHIDSLCYDLTRRFEELGFRSVMTISRSESMADALIGDDAALKGRLVHANTVVTRLPIAEQRRLPAPSAQPENDTSITDRLVALALELGASLCGVAPAARLDRLADQLRPHFEGVAILDAIDRSPRFGNWQPDVRERECHVKTASDHLAGARSVFVFGLRLHEAVLEFATMPPAEAVGPYAFQTYIANWLGTAIGYRLVKRLQEWGFSAIMTMDLTGTETALANPRGPQPDLTANRFAGIAAGLGYLTRSGQLATPEFGVRQRLVAIVTDAPLAPSPLPLAVQSACDSCDSPCVSWCTAQAITEEAIDLVCEGVHFGFRRRDLARCDWEKRYALMGDSGFKYLGSEVDLAPPETITAEALVAGLRQIDPIKKHRPAVAPQCVLSCPLATDPEFGMNGHTLRL